MAYFVSVFKLKYYKVKVISINRNEWHSFDEKSIVITRCDSPGYIYAELNNKALNLENLRPLKIFEKNTLRLKTSLNQRKITYLELDL